MSNININLGGYLIHIFWILITLGQSVKVILNALSIGF
jgi:hypothetical protein